MNLVCECVIQVHYVLVRCKHSEHVWVGIMIKPHFRVPEAKASLICVWHCHYCDTPWRKMCLLSVGDRGVGPATKAVVSTAIIPNSTHLLLS